MSHESGPIQEVVSDEGRPAVPYRVPGRLRPFEHFLGDGGWPWWILLQLNLLRSWIWFLQYPIFLQILRELWCDTSMQTLLQSIEFSYTIGIFWEENHPPKKYPDFVQKSWSLMTHMLSELGALITLKPNGFLLFHPQPWHLKINIVSFSALEKTHP